MNKTEGLLIYDDVSPLRARLAQHVASVRTETLVVRESLVDLALGWEDLRTVELSTPSRRADAGPEELPVLRGEL